MSEAKLLSRVKPLLELLPEVSPPERREAFQERATTSIIAVLIFLVLSQLPLYGIQSATADPFYHQRSMIASSRGTLMELGVGPILTSGILMQIFSSARLFEINHNLSDDRMAFQGLQKLFAFIFAFAQSVFFVVAGLYGSPASIGLVNSVLIVAQLFGASVVVILLDEMLQKGHGLGSGVSLFTSVAIATEVVWKTLSPSSIVVGDLKQYVGALIALPHLLFTRPDKLSALMDGLFLREGMGHCSIFAILVALAVGAATAYFLTWRIEVVVKYQKYRAQQGKYPIKLFYTSNLPLVMYAVVAGNIFMISQVLYAAFPNSLLVHITGKWELQHGPHGLVIPTAGIPYYISPPQSLLELVFDPFHVLFYGVLLLSMSATFSKIWVEVSGLTAKAIAKDLREQDIVIKGHRDTALEHELNRYIPTAAELGGVIIGGLSFLADLFGSAVSGSSIVVLVTVVFQYYEIVLRESGGLLQNILGDLA
jgi:protein transport protein SEC61 subunit alpha